jgi:hypothetical protein
MSDQRLTGDHDSRSPALAGRREFERSLDECWGRVSTLHRKVDGSSPARTMTPERASGPGGPSSPAPARPEPDRVDALLTAVIGAAHVLLQRLEGPRDGARAAGGGPQTSTTGITQWNVRSLDC